MCVQAIAESACHRSGFPDAPFPDPSIYEALGSEKIRDLVRYHHQLMWQSDIQPVFGSDFGHFAKTVEHTANYFIEMLGGPKLFTVVRGEPKLGRRHKPFNLTPYHRVIWLDCFRLALKEKQIPISIAQEIWNWVEPLSMRFLTPRIEAEHLAREYLMAAKDYD
ncbi:MAG: hypothetical protein JXK16_10355 [Thiotrichales bacterium]|nr:hypothetical protein [Thiotrichales bacterium]